MIISLVGFGHHMRGASSFEERHFGPRSTLDRDQSIVGYLHASRDDDPFGISLEPSISIDAERHLDSDSLNLIVILIAT